MQAGLHLADLPVQLVVLDVVVLQLVLGVVGLALEVAHPPAQVVLAGAEPVELVHVSRVDPVLLDVLDQGHRRVADGLLLLADVDDVVAQVRQVLLDALDDVLAADDVDDDGLGPGAMLLHLLGRKGRPARGVAVGQVVVGHLGPDEDLVAGAGAEARLGLARLGRQTQRRQVELVGGDHALAPGPGGIVRVGDRAERLDDGLVVLLPLQPIVQREGRDRVVVAGVQRGVDLRVRSHLQLALGRQGPDHVRPLVRGCLDVVLRLVVPVVVVEVAALRVHLRVDEIRRDAGVAAHLALEAERQRLVRNRRRPQVRGPPRRAVAVEEELRAGLVNPQRPVHLHVDADA
ncbi:MAG: hypothetical protein BIFFINMI_03782 [Phycisphaerae bacterium]|nr:hypothetical protein [Phycisphaerae bacterium]